MGSQAKVRTRAATASAIATALILATSPGSAAGSGFTGWIDSGHSDDCDIDAGTRYATFVDEGEHIYLSDQVADGCGVAADIVVNDSRLETVVDKEPERDARARASQG